MNSKKIKNPSPVRNDYTEIWERLSSSARRRWGGWYLWSGFVALLSRAVSYVRGSSYSDIKITADDYLKVIHQKQQKVGEKPDQSVSIEYNGQLISVPVYDQFDKDRSRNIYRCEEVNGDFYEFDLGEEFDEVKNRVFFALCDHKLKKFTKLSWLLNQSLGIELLLALNKYLSFTIELLQNTNQKICVRKEANGDITLSYEVCQKEGVGYPRLRYQEKDSYLYQNLKNLNIKVSLVLRDHGGDNYEWCAASEDPIVSYTRVGPVFDCPVKAQTYN